MITADKMNWAKLLDDALTEPGRISDAYHRFCGCSLGNSVWAMMQCLRRTITPGPLASFYRWKELGREVRKGSKAITLCMPLTCKRDPTDKAGNETGATYQIFVLKKELVCAVAKPRARSTSRNPYRIGTRHSRFRGSASRRKNVKF